MLFSSWYGINIRHDHGFGALRLGLSSREILGLMEPSGGEGSIQRRRPKWGREKQNKKKRKRNEKKKK